MKRVRYMAAALALFAAIPSAAAAENYTGRLDLVEVTSANPARHRFFVRGSRLSLFAESAMANVLLGAFYRKASVSIGYTIVPCGGYTGTCGQVVFASVDATGIP